MNSLIAIRIARASAGFAGPSLGNARTGAPTVTEKVIKSDKSSVLLTQKDCNWLARVLHFLRSRPYPQLADRP
jgi:hypothetical protein